MEIVIFHEMRFLIKQPFLELFNQACDINGNPGLACFCPPLFDASLGIYLVFKKKTAEICRGW